MSAKWVRVKRWDDEHLRGPLLPLKWLLRLFSSVWFAVGLLVLVVMYGTLASVPVGLIAKIPTLLIISATFLAVLALGAWLPVWLIARGMKRVGVSGKGRFVWWVVGLVALGIVASAAWWWAVWPQLRYDPTTGKGLMLFASFVERYKAVQARRLPGMEMSELEFYAWWPLTLVLVLFVLNLVTATVRRIEFIFPKVGVLMVHTGIVTIALGSVLYAGMKQEGDMILEAGMPGADGAVPVGPPQSRFFDNTDVALWVRNEATGRWGQRPLRGVPRYNDYNLGAASGTGSAATELVAEQTRATPAHRDFGALRVAVPGSEESRGAAGGAGGQTQDRFTYRIVGYAGYAEMREMWVTGDAAADGGEMMREVEIWLTRPDPEGKSPADVSRPQKIERFIPRMPAGRVSDLEGVLGIEYTAGMDEKRWEELQTPLPAGTRHALMVEVPSKGFRQLYVVNEGTELMAGETGYKLRVKQLLARPPFPIITKGYENAVSSVAVVRIQPPAATDGVVPAGFDRWVYHRFPEISQEMLDEMGPTGMPKRRDPDAAIKVAYIDASMVQVYIDERATGKAGEAPTARAIVRLPAGGVTVSPNLKVGDDVQVAPALKLRLGKREDHAHRVEVPFTVAEIEQNKSMIGNHQSAAVAVEVSSADGKRSRTVWLPFTQYVGVDERNIRRVDFGNGEVTEIAFGRVQHVLPMSLSLKHFEMTPYPHSETPRDYRSEVVVSSRWGQAGAAGGEVRRDEVRSTSLNEPLLVRVPFQDHPNVPRVMNWLGRAVSWVVPVQYKFAQAGWDSSGWRESQKMVADGRLKAPYARFTILGVGNNPGIYVIATGAVLMSVGIPWAFYLKPVLMQRRKRKLQRELAKEGRLPAHLMHELGYELAKEEGAVPAQISDGRAHGGNAHNGQRLNGEARATDAEPAGERK